MTEHRPNRTYSLRDLEAYARANGFRAEADRCAEYLLLQPHVSRAWHEVIDLKLPSPAIVPHSARAAA